jgi:hypothetical protein
MRSPNLADDEEEERQRQNDARSCGNRSPDQLGHLKQCSVASVRGVTGGIRLVSWRSTDRYLLGVPGRTPKGGVLSG